MHLTQADYGRSYYDGVAAGDTHPAGYSSYTATSQNWAAIADLFAPYINAGDRVLEVGCAKGFLVAELRRRGIDAVGLDFSAYAIAESDPDAAIYGVDILNDPVGETYDLIITKDTLCVFSDADLEILIPKLNGLAPRQVHKLFETPNPEYYNVKTQAEWEALGWNNATFI